MKPPRLLRRWLRQDAAGPLPVRSCVQPPAVWGQAEPVWRSLWDWLRAAPHRDARRSSALTQAQHDFAAALVDVHGHAALDLRRRGQTARSLRELWHLRADLYSLIATHLSQSEAERRLQRVNRHFATSPTAGSAASRTSRISDV